LNRKMEIDTIVCGDCLDVMADMPDGCVDLVMTSPPYWNLKDYGIKGQIGFGQTVKEYIESLALIVSECYRLAPWVVVNLDDKERSPPEPLVAKLLAKEVAPFWQIIIWWKRNATPYNMPKKVHPKHEYCLVFGPGETFNLDTILQPYSEASRKDKRPYKGHRSGANPGSVWDIPAHYGPRNSNTATFPTALPTRFISLYTDMGDIVFDPFMGSGTTAVAALKLGRHFYGCDINPEYVGLANERIEKTRLQMAQLSFCLDENGYR
jgi:DNA modification methylase